MANRKTGAAGKVRLFVLIKRPPRWQATAVTSASSDVPFTDTPDVNVSKPFVRRTARDMTCPDLNIINIGDFYDQRKVRSVFLNR